MSDEKVAEATESIDVGAFLDRRWGTAAGKVYIATLERGRKTSFKQYLQPWPIDRAKIIKNVQIMTNMGLDVFYCPSVFKADAPRVAREYVQSANMLWVDLDGNAPESWELKCKELDLPTPTEVVQSSVPGHQHAYWMTSLATTDEDLDRHETFNRNLAAAFQADMGGWDLPQLLRIPGTYNYGWAPSDAGGVHKPWWSEENPVAQISVRTEEAIPPASFTALTNAERQILSRLAIGSVPPIKEVLALGKWTSEMFNHFNMTKDEAVASSPNKRSGALQKLAYYSAENGFSDEQIYSILDDADTRWEKYTTRHKSGRDKILRDSIARARAKLGYLVGGELTLAGIVSGTAPETEPKFVFNYREFMDAEFHVDWLLEGLIPAEGLGMLVADPNAGKTRLSLQMAYELAIGYDRIIRWNNPTGAKKVGYLSLEMGGNELHEFMKNYSVFYDNDSLVLERNLHIVPLGVSLHLDTPQGQSFVKNFLSQYKKDVLFIDSLQESISTALTDELGVKALMQFVKELRRTYGVSIVFIHHNRKPSQDSKNAARDASDSYGHQFIQANLDWQLGLQEVGNYVRLSELKNRFFRKGEPIDMYGDGIKFVVQNLGAPNGSSEPDASGNAALRI